MPDETQAFLERDSCRGQQDHVRKRAANPKNLPLFAHLDREEFDYSCSPIAVYRKHNVEWPFVKKKSPGTPLNSARELENRSNSCI